MRKWLLLMVVLLPLMTSVAMADKLEVEFSHSSGFYEEPFTLRIACNDAAAKVYYTTDGTVPDETSLKYDGAVALGWSNERADKLMYITDISCDQKPFRTVEDFPTGHIVRAIAMRPDGTKSDVISGTYFVGYDRHELYGNTAIMLLVINEEDLFDYEKGIYVTGKCFDEWLKTNSGEIKRWKVQANYTQSGMDWERGVSVTYLPAQGEGFVQDMGVRIKGNSSRSDGQKSLRLIAREKYGIKNVKYKLFADNVRERDGSVVSKYKSFTLRNGGNDYLNASIRDPFIANLATGLRFETAQNMPCIAFINGEFWGIYTLTEEYTDNYIQYHYGIDNDNVITIKNGKVEDGEESDFKAFKNMFDYIVKNDMADQACYEQASELLDMGSFADYCALQLYIYNQDGPLQGNNWQMWRVRQENIGESTFADGKWRMMLYDTDFSSGIYCDGENAAEDNITPILNGDHGTGRNLPRLLVALLNNEEFRMEFLRACCDVRNLYFECHRMQAQFDKMQAEYLPYVPDTLRRFGPAWTLKDPQKYYSSELGYLNLFFTNRCKTFLPIVQTSFGLGEACAITVNVSEPAKGQVYLNGRTIPTKAGVEYMYFPGCGLTVTAVPAEGATFTGWTVSHSSVKVADDKALTTEITFNRMFTLTANFE